MGQNTLFLFGAFLILLNLLFIIRAYKIRKRFRREVHEEKENGLLLERPIDHSVDQEIDLNTVEILMYWPKDSSRRCVVLRASLDEKQVVQFEAVNGTQEDVKKIRDIVYRYHVLGMRRGSNWLVDQKVDYVSPTKNALICAWPTGGQTYLNAILEAINDVNCVKPIAWFAMRPPIRKVA